jgi:amino acid adenylation domain-containing protein
VTKLLQHWVTSQAQHRPHDEAVVCDQENITYERLEEVANRLARALKFIGCRRGDRVSLLLPKSLRAIIGILGTLKADCIYVPMDTSSPVARLSRILESCESRCILATRSAAVLLDKLMSNGKFRESLSVGWLDSRDSMELGMLPGFCWEDLSSFSADAVSCENTSESVAHILFTSGSTGIPKGVQITHSNVTHFVDWAIRYFGTSASDRISCHPPLHFDLSTFDIFGTLAAGAQLHLVPPSMSLLPHKLADFIRDSELTQWFSVPSILNYMAKFDAVRFNDFPSLRRLLWCGETFPTPSLIYWMSRLPKVTFTNLYGPTEATIASSYYRVPKCPENVRSEIPIGTACDGEELLVLNDRLERCPPGETGDLYIRGVGLSPGYWRDAEKTKAVFLQNPSGFDARDQIYKTGDLALIGDDGLVYLVGRADSQVKCRGYRIELGEIELAINSIEGVRECAVVAIPTDGFESTIISCAYAKEPDSELSPLALRKRLEEVLPQYMVPSRWLPLEQLPLNASGKTDRPRLKTEFQSVTSPFSAAWTAGAQERR